MKGRTYLLCWLIMGLPQPGLAGVKEMLSPSGRNVIRYQELEHKTFPAGSQNVDDVNHVRYQISITNSATGHAVKFDWADVYGWAPDAGPRPVQKLASWFVWSPNEDFVFVPDEDWASAPSSAVYWAINLNPGFAWEKQTVSFDKRVWLDEYNLVTEVSFDCAYRVELFDGRTGKITTIAPARSPVGYYIHEIAEEYVLLKSMTDNCATPEFSESFAPRCLRLDIATRKISAQDCPP